jgi:alkanesulfonate monooxygenase SsuD/methylene tetrahydromethanopterin reductase-like flavin-dependent oxidoreductase (luciferase family)
MADQLRFGLWYDFRNPPAWKQDGTRLYAEILNQIERAEGLGWDDIWLSEHHFFDDAYTPSMLPLGCAIAARTQKVEIGTSVLLLPLHDPVRVAEDAATLDVLSGGRLQLGLGVGYRVEEFIGFDIPRGERAARMDEELTVIRRLFDGEKLTFEGKYYSYRDIELFPKPVQRRAKLWIGGFSEPAVRRAARTTKNSRSRARTPRTTRWRAVSCGSTFRATRRNAGRRPKSTSPISSTATPSGSATPACSSLIPSAAAPSSRSRGPTS